MRKLSLGLLGVLAAASLFGQTVQPPQNSSEGRRHRAGLHLELHPGRKGETVRFPRQEHRRTGVLSRRFYRWLNEGILGIPVWYCKI